MAILDAVPGIKVTVRVGNADCVEYDDPDPENPQGSSFTCPTSIKYIEAITDAEFGIRYAVDSSYAWGYRNHKLKLSIRIDSKHFKSPVVSPEYPKGYRLSMDERTDHGTWVRRKPKFSPMSTVDDTSEERLEKDRQLAKNLGLITVKVCRVIKHGTYRGDESHTNFEDSSHVIAEKAIKGREISHATVLSPGQHRSEPVYSYTSVLPEDNGPIAVFHFRYRSKEALRRELVIPRSSTMPTGFGDPKSGVKIKKKRSTTKLEVKQEPVQSFDLTLDDSPPSGAEKTGETEVIDLTDD